MLRSWRNYTPTGFGQLVKNNLTGEELTFAIPTLSPEQWAAGYVVYDDALRSDWYLDVWKAEADMVAENVVHSGQLAIASMVTWNSTSTADHRVGNPSKYSCGIQSISRR
jgi:hypothetical protein